MQTKNMQKWTETICKLYEKKYNLKYVLEIPLNGLRVKWVRNDKCNKENENKIEGKIWLKYPTNIYIIYSENAL